MCPLEELIVNKIKADVITNYFKTTHSPLFIIGNNGVGMGKENPDIKFTSFISYKHNITITYNSDDKLYCFEGQKYTESEFKRVLSLLVFI